MNPTPTLSAKETVEEWKARGREALEVFAGLLAQNELTDEQIYTLESIRKEWGDHPLFKQARDDAYDSRMMHSGFGAPNCSCHINPPCSACIDYTSHCHKCGEYLEENEIDTAPKPTCNQCLNAAPIPPIPNA